MQEILHFRVFTLRNLWYCSAGLWCSQLSYFITVESVLWLHPKTKHAVVKDAKNLKKHFIPRQRFHPVCKFRGWDDSDVEPPELSLSLWKGFLGFAALCTDSSLSHVHQTSPTSLSRSCLSCSPTPTLSTLWTETQPPCTCTGQRSINTRSKVPMSSNGWYLCNEDRSVCLSA